MIWLAVSNAAAAGLSDMIALCEQAVAQGKVPAALAQVLKQDPRNAFVKTVTTGTKAQPIFVTVIERTDQGTLICMLEGARHLSGTRWQGDYAWASSQQIVDAALRQSLPRTAQNVLAKPDALDLHLYQTSFIDCASNRYWNAGPHYKSDGGYLFPVTIDWRLDGAVMSYQVGRGLFPTTRQTYCN